MRKIYIDCGFYRGVALRQYVDKGIVDKSWDIYVFEPNTDLGVEKQIADFFPDLPVKLLKKAVWTEDGKVKFHIGGREDAASVEGTSGHSDYKEITVSSIDFSKFVGELPEAYIICNMDIEGAEFTVLPKMINDGTIDRFDELDIEFHHRLVQEYDESHSQSLINEIIRRGIKMRLKVPLI